MGGWARELLHHLREVRETPRQCDVLAGHTPRDVAEQYRAALHAGDQAEIDRLAAILDAPAGEPKLKAAALAYASWGWPVFPLKPGQKVPATKNGFKDATTDKDRLARWWDRNPHSNIGLPTGHAFDVVDVDAPKGWPS